MRWPRRDGPARAGNLREVGGRGRLRERDAPFHTREFLLLEFVLTRPARVGVSSDCLASENASVASVSNERPHTEAEEQCLPFPSLNRFC